MLLAEADANQREDKPEVDGQEQQRESDKGPESAVHQGGEPTRHEQKEGGRLHQAAAQVIDNLPARNQRDGILHQLARFIRNAIEDPAHDLPVAAQPAMLAAIIGAVVRRIIVDDFDIGGQTGARIGAFNQVVAEQRIARESDVPGLGASASTS